MRGKDSKKLEKLKKLTEDGDPNARKKFKEEIVKRLLFRTETSTRRLLNDGYHSSLSNEEITQLINDFEIEKATDRVLINFLLVLRYLAEKRLSLIKEQAKQIIRKIFLAERFFVIRFILENGILRKFKLYTEGAIYPYLTEKEIKELIEQLDLLKILTLESKLGFEILSGVANLGSLKAKTLLKQEIRKSLIHGDFSIIQFLIQGFYLNRFSEEELNRIYQTIDVQKITRSQSLEVFPILKKIALKNPKIEEMLKEEISKRFLQGEFKTVKFLVGDYYLHKLSEAERIILIENLNFSKIIEDKSPQMIPLLERLAEMGSNKAKNILEEVVIKRLLRGDFTTIITSIPKLSYIPNEKIVELLRDFNFKKITTEKPKKFLPLLLKIAQLGSPEAIEVLRKEVKNIMQNGKEEEIVFLMNSVGSYIDIEHYFHFFSENELDNIFRSLDYEKFVEKKFEMLNIPDVEKKFLIKLQKSMKKQFQILTNDYEIKRNHIVKLNLSNKSIKMLPESICDLVALRDLDLNFNNLKVLPELIGELKSLVSLKVTANNLEFLPESIKNLDKLESLDLRFNQLKNLPDSIGDLHKLKWISLCCNHLESIPRSIGSEIERRREKIEQDIKLYPHKRYKSYKKLNRIRINELDLSGNKIKNFPLSKNNSALEVLDLSDTPFLTNYIDFQNILIISQLNKWGMSSNNHWKEKLEKFILSYEVDLHEEILEAIKPKFIMRKHYIRDEKNIDIGVSKFGGNPDVPNNFAWPYWAGRPLSFLMQLNIADMNNFKDHIFSVKKGILYFFYDPHQEEWGANPLNNNAWRVIYVDEKMSNLKRRTNPSHNRRFTYPPCLITLYQDISLPRDPHHIFPDYSFKEINEIKDNYYEFYNNLFEDSLARYIFKMNLEWLSRRTLWSMKKHYLFGYPDEIQEIGIWKGWTQLLQLGDDSIMRWKWGSGGIVHFLIRETDLKKNYYGDVRLIIDCS